MSETKCKYEVGQSFRAAVPFSQPAAYKVHVTHVLDSAKYSDKLIVYAVYGKRKQSWHEFMCYEFEMDQYRERAERIHRNSHNQN